MRYKLYLLTFKYLIYLNNNMILITLFKFLFLMLIKFKLNVIGIVV